MLMPCVFAVIIKLSSNERMAIALLFLQGVILCLSISMTNNVEEEEGYKVQKKKEFVSCSFSSTETDCQISSKLSSGKNGQGLVVDENSSHNKTILKGSKDIIASKKSLLKEKRRKINGVNSLEVGTNLIKQRRESLGSNVSCFYADEGGLVIEEGEGCYMIDIDGNRYLDCCNNVACVGHSHPKVVEAGVAALSKIQTNARFLHPGHQRYIGKLLKTFPSQLNTVYLVNSGSEANDLALRIAKAHADLQGIAQKPNDVICLDSGK